MQPASEKSVHEGRTQVRFIERYPPEVMEECGYTGSACVGIALHDAILKGKLRELPTPSPPLNTFALRTT